MYESKMSLRFNLALLLMFALLTQLVDGRRKLCGDALNEALDLICVNGFSHRIKRDCKYQSNSIKYQFSYSMPALKRTEADCCWY